MAHHLLTLACVTRGMSTWWKTLIRSQGSLFTMHQPPYKLFYWTLCTMAGCQL